MVLLRSDSNNPDSGVFCAEEIPDPGKGVLETGLPLAHPCRGHGEHCAARQMDRAPERNRDSRHNRDIPEMAQRAESDENNQRNDFTAVIPALCWLSSFRHLASFLVRSLKRFRCVRVRSPEVAAVPFLVDLNAAHHAQVAGNRQSKVPCSFGIAHY